jgi:FecR protein
VLRLNTVRLTSALVLALIATAPAAGTSKRDARVTRLIREVSLLPTDAPLRRAVLNDTVPETTAVKTGNDSRAELTFADLTITRLGANSLYSFKNAGRRVELNTGSTLLRIPKDSRGATILSPAVTVGITGTTVIFEHIRGGPSRLIVLEGTARLTLVRARDQQRGVAAGGIPRSPARCSSAPRSKTDRSLRAHENLALDHRFPCSPESKPHQQRHSPAAAAARPAEPESAPGPARPAEQRSASTARTAVKPRNKEASSVYFFVNKKDDASSVGSTP